MAREQLSLCFLKKDNQFLLINRNKPPFMGQWNAVGGHKIETETIQECAKREVFEETQLIVNNLELVASFTWNYDDGLGFIFVADILEDISLSSYPQKTDEGILDFKSIDWINHPKNTGIIDDIKVFINEIYDKNIRNIHYHLTYDKNRLIDVQHFEGILNQ